jgi:hypothetical protein
MKKEVRGYTIEPGAANSSIRPLNYEVLDQSNKDMVDRIDSFKAPWLEEKLLDKNVFKSREEFQEAFLEFKKFVILSDKYDGSIAMTSEKVDEVWHQFILFTPQYHQFCEETLGSYLHHEPTTSNSNPGEKRNFVDIYEATFGDIPNMWNTELEVCMSGGCLNTSCGMPAPEEE